MPVKKNYVQVVIVGTRRANTNQSGGLTGGKYKESEVRMSETKHTPTPWWNESGVIHAQAADWTPEEHNCCHPAYANQNIDPEDGDTDANAEFIVRACNNYDKLLATCKESRRRIIAIQTTCEVKRDCAWLTYLDDVIAEAQAEQKPDGQ